MEKFGFGFGSGFSELPTGCIVGKARLVEVKHYKDKEEHALDRERHLADDAWGNYGFVLSGAERTKVIECKGKLGFWEIDAGKEGRNKKRI